jgi:hypothetical protein
VNQAIAGQRLRNQGITRSTLRRPVDVVAWLGAVQAQEYPAARWALALRMPEGVTDASIQRDVDEGRILRLHVLRPTWHFVPADDVRWMLELTAPRVHRALGSYHRSLGLDPAACVRAASIFERALDRGRCLTRAELGAALARKGFAVSGVKLALLTVYAEVEGIMCNGPHRGKQLTYASLAARAPQARRLSRDEALGELARRFLRSHAPATIRDFVWWSGLTTADAKRGLEVAHARKSAIDGLTYWIVDQPARRPAPRRSVHLLPVYDEYLVAYRDREAVPHLPPTVPRAAPHAVVIAGQIAGVWRFAAGASGIRIDVTAFRPLIKPERQAIRDIAERFGRFRAAPVTVSLI